MNKCAKRNCLSLFGDRAEGRAERTRHLESEHQVEHIHFMGIQGERSITNDQNVNKAVLCLLLPIVLPNYISNSSDGSQPVFAFTVQKRDEI